MPSSSKNIMGILFSKGNSAEPRRIPNNLAVNGFSHQDLKNITAPKVPVIFVLGGPGSGKITHCDSLSRDNPNFLHVNMTEIYNHLQRNVEKPDPMMIPTSRVTQTLAAVMMARPMMDGFLVSAYPRDEKDAEEYLERIGRLDGVIYINWKQENLQRQIEYGVKFNEIDELVAMTELRNFRDNVLPGVDYLAERNYVHSVEGDRNPAEVYDDIVKTFHKILQGDPELKSLQSTVSHPLPPVVHAEATPVPPALTNLIAQPVVWIIGGPGSQKMSKMDRIMDNFPTWTTLQTGQMIRDHIEEQEDEESKSELQNVYDSGELFDQDLILELIEAAVKDRTEEGIFLLGYPRSIEQAAAFQDRFQRMPETVLIDCSEPELMRGLGQKNDSSSNGDQRKMEIYRDLTLPLMKALDDEERLHVVDGDTEEDNVVADLETTIREVIERLGETNIMTLDEINEAEEDAIPEEEEEPGDNANDGDDGGDGDEDNTGEPPDGEEEDKDEEEEDAGDKIEEFLDELEKEIDEDFTKLEEDIANGHTSPVAIG